LHFIQIDGFNNYLKFEGKRWSAVGYFNAAITKKYGEKIAHRYNNFALQYYFLINFVETKRKKKFVFERIIYLIRVLLLFIIFMYTLLFNLERLLLFFYNKRYTLQTALCAHSKEVSN
jgi:hypothetical protein